MAIPAECIQWSKLENTISEKGYNWTANGAVSYEAVKFNNGVRLDGVGESLTVVDMDTMLQNTGCIAYWVKMLYASGSAGNKGIMQIGTYAAGSTTFQIYYTAGSITWAMWDGANRSTCNSNIAWAANEIIHLAFTWDIAATPKLQIYINGVDATNTTADVVWAALQSPLLFSLGQAVGQTPNFIVDNIKIWDYAKTDFSDRETEGFAEDPGFHMINGGIQSPLMGNSLLIK